MAVRWLLIGCFPPFVGLYHSRTVCHSTARCKFLFTTSCLEIHPFPPPPSKKFSPCFLRSSCLSLGLNTRSDLSSPALPPPKKICSPPSAGPSAASFSRPQISPWIILPHLLSDTSLLLIIFFFQTHLSLAWHFTPALAFPLPPAPSCPPSIRPEDPPQPAHGGSVTVALPGQGTAGPGRAQVAVGEGVGPGPARRGRPGAEGPSRQRPDTSILWHPSSSRRG